MAELRLYESWQQGHDIDITIQGIVDKYSINYRPYRAEVTQADRDMATKFAKSRGVQWTYQRQSKTDDGPLRLYVQTQSAQSKYSPTVLLHRLVTSAAFGRVVDHVDGNTLNNYRRNLRVGTVRANNANRRFHTSKFRGVRPVGPRWAAEIYVGGRWIPLGVFSYERAAAKAYNEAAWRVHEDAALLNSL